MKIDKLKHDKLKESLQVCMLHQSKMMFAFSKVSVHFPFDKENYASLSMEDQSFIDQLIYRFIKLQDSMGMKLFPTTLDYLGEEVTGVPFIDLLNKMEEISLLEDAKQWILLRETRNLVTHEYPFSTDEIIEGLNLLSKHVLLLQEILSHIYKYLQQRGVTA